MIVIKNNHLGATQLNTQNKCEHNNKIKKPSLCDDSFIADAMVSLYRNKVSKTITSISKSKQLKQWQDILHKHIKMRLVHLTPLANIDLIKKITK